MLINVLCIKALYDVIIIVFIKKNKKKINIMPGMLFILKVFGII